MIIFIEVLPKPFKCIAKFLKRSVENSWVKYSLKKNSKKTKWKGGKVFIETLGGVEIFKGSVENSLRVLGTGEGCFKTFKEYYVKILGRVCLLNVLKVCLSGV
jgi:hypothetical protein